MPPSMRSGDAFTKGWRVTYGGGGWRQYKIKPKNVVYSIKHSKIRCIMWIYHISDETVFLWDLDSISKCDFGQFVEVTENA